MRFILLIVALLHTAQQFQLQLLLLLAHNKCQRLNNILIEINYSQLEQATETIADDCGSASATTTFKYPIDLNLLG